MNGKVSNAGDPGAMLRADTRWMPELAEERVIWAEGQRTEVTYEFRIFLPRCETYAIQFAGSEVTGVCGPLEYDEVLFNALSNFPYEKQRDDVAWVKANFSDFVPCEAECEEGTLWI